MKNSLSFYVTIWIIRLKGLKKIFSGSPIDYKKLRKDDVHRPKSRFLKQNITAGFNVLQSRITEIRRQEGSERLLLFIHGGAFISGPSKHHWDTVETISRRTDYTIWMCDYPKAPEYTIDTISENIDAVYRLAMDKFDPHMLVLAGDSVGGTLVTALVQRLSPDDVPARIILVSPVADATLSNPDIDAIDKKDPMLSKKGVLSAKEMAAGQSGLTDPSISPVNGNFQHFPETTLFLAENDITYPDQKRLVEKLRDAGVKYKVVTGHNMPHIWPFLPVMKEAKHALHKIVLMLNR